MGEIMIKRFSAVSVMLFAVLTITAAALFCDDVKFAEEHGLLDGIYPERFNPNGYTTKAMTAQFIYNHAQRPEMARWFDFGVRHIFNMADEGVNEFDDVAEDAWYRDAVVWSARVASMDRRTVEGTTILFDPYDYVTREEFIFILQNYISTRADFTHQRESTVFTDNDNIRSYMRESVDRFYRAGIIDARQDGSFDPKGFITGAEFAAIISAFAKSVGIEELPEDYSPPIICVVDELMIRGIRNNYQPLTINLADEITTESPSFNAYWTREITNEELFAAFSGLERLNPVGAQVSYNGSKLNGISISIIRAFTTSYGLTSARIIVGGERHTETFVLDYEPVVSDVLGIPVIAKFSSHIYAAPDYAAYFELDGIPYRVRVRNDYPLYGRSSILEVIVNEVIRNYVIDGHRADLSVFGNPAENSAIVPPIIFEAAERHIPSSAKNRYKARKFYPQFRIEKKFHELSELYALSDKDDKTKNEHLVLLRLKETRLPFSDSASLQGIFVNSLGIRIIYSVSDMVFNFTAGSRYYKKPSANNTNYRLTTLGDINIYITPTDPNCPTVSFLLCIDGEPVYVYVSIPCEFPDTCTRGNGFFCRGGYGNCLGERVNIHAAINGLLQFEFITLI
jgi:hypothetical protein